MIDKSTRIASMAAIAVVIACGIATEGAARSADGRDSTSDWRLAQPTKLASISPASTGRSGEHVAWLVRSTERPSCHVLGCRSFILLGVGF
jgi:hypothetical protein